MQRFGCMTRPLEGKATIKAKKVLKGGTFREGQFSFALKDAEGKVLRR